MGLQLDKLASKRVPWRRSVLSVGCPRVHGLVCAPGPGALRFSSPACLAPWSTPEFQCGRFGGPLKH